MSRQQLLLGSLAVASVCCAMVVIQAGAVTTGADNASKPRPRAEQGTTEQKTMHKNMATTQELGGKDRYLTFISTDKPIYRTGEKVYVRGVLLNAANHQPLAAGLNANPTIQIKGPKGDIVASGRASAQDSVWGFSWDVPAEQAGGEYTLQATYPWDGHAPAERKFDIRAYRAPRLNSQITFMRDGYGPGEKVAATLDVKRAEGGVPEGAKVTVTARVDGIEVQGGTAKVDENGLCSVSFDLPREIPRGEGTLALTIEDGGVIETATKTIPILLQTVDLQTFPEGGDLVAGYANRLYIQATQPNGKPADLAGKLVSKQTGSTVTEFRTEHEGRGRFIFTPEADRAYFLSISEPAGIKTLYPLPKIKSSGAVLRADQDVFENAQPVSVQVGCTAKNYRVTLSKREEEIAACKVDMTKRPDVQAGTLLPVTFALPADIDGVLTVTVWDEKDTPIAERIVFRKPASPLKVSITPDKKSYVPGDNAKLTVKATDANGKPVSAVVGVTVTDESVLEMVEKREQAPRLPVMLFLEPEVKDLADAHVYLDAGNPKASLATDLLLGTQGWRRFALMDLPKFIEASGDQARRVVALKIQSQFEQDKAAMAAGADGFGGGVMMMRQRGGGPMPPGAAPMPMLAAAAAPQDMAPPPVNAPRPQPQGNAAPPMPPPVPAPALARADFRQIVAEPMPRQQAAGKLEQAIVASAERQAKRAIVGFAKERALADDMIANSMVLVREFAHQVRPNRQPTDRVDFEETLYWNAGVKTDATTGEATISFGLNDSVSTFRVFADGFSGAGAVGTSKEELKSVQPFYAEAKLPLEVTAGDKILLPISLINGTNGDLADASVNVDMKGDFKIAEVQKSGAIIGTGSRVRWMQPITVGYGNGSKAFTLTAKAGLFEDNVTRKLSVKPMGFPMEASFGGILEPGQVVTHKITVPKNVVPESLVSNCAVYPTPLANLTEALERLIQDPYGCFEQTSSTSYPLTMAQQYFLSHTGIDPKLVETSKQKLDKGYKQLVGFWCPDKGYEWFGENPGHEALTAFGLLHFHDMSAVREVDQNMIASTRSWLFKQKDGQGGFSRKRRALHTWTEDKDCSNAYILWSLLETGQPAADLKAEIDSLKKAAKESQNSYAIALAANAFFLSGDKADAIQLADRLAAKQKEDGSVEGIKSSIVGSGGEALQIEGTSLATLAWLRDPKYAGNVEKSIKFLADSCKAGRYGSTQSTVLALRAIVTYDKQRARPKAPGKVRVYVDGQSIGDWSSFNLSTQGAIKLPDLSELLTPGEHKLELRMEGGSPMPYSMAVKYNAITPASSADCKLDLSVKIAQEKVVEGTTTEANVMVTNKTDEVVPTPIAIVGLPGGLEPRHDQLKELVKKGTIDAYEVRGREVVLYWRTMDKNAKVEVPLSLVAAIPGNYTGPASRTYLYYTDEHKKWVDGVQVEITAK